MEADPSRRRGETCSNRMPDEQGTVIAELCNSAGETVRLALPRWTLPQLMRVLPQLAATGRQDDVCAGHSLIAYGVAAWNVEAAGPGLGVAMHFRNEREADAAFYLERADAIALHQALGSAIARCAPRRPDAGARVPA